MHPKRKLTAAVLASIVFGLAAGCGTRHGAAPSSARPARTDPATARLIAEVTTVPPRLLDAAARNAMVPDAMPSKVAGAPLTAHGKPEVFYDSTQFCPFCAMQSWPLIVALSRFGTFSGLTPIRSAAWAYGSIKIPPLDTWSFYHATYTSSYLAFVPVEQRSNVLVSPTAKPGHFSSYRTLQRLTPAQQALVGKYDTAGAVPFLDFGNRAALTGALYVQTALLDKTGKRSLSWSQIAGALSVPGDSTGQAIRNAAAYVTAQLCALTANQPTAVCSPAIRALQSLS